MIWYKKRNIQNEFDDMKSFDKTIEKSFSLFAKFHGFTQKKVCFGVL